MNEYVWLFPLIFIFHDMEEIIGLGLWLNRNDALLREKHPGILKLYSDFSTSGFALAVFEELCVCLLICVLALFSGSSRIWLLWLGAFIACALHFVVHLAQSVVLRQYIPAAATSLLCLPLSILIIIRCLRLLPFANVEGVVFILAGIAVTALNLRFAQSLVGRFTRYSNRTRSD